MTKGVKEMAWKPPKMLEEMFGKEQRTYKTTGTQYTRGDYRKMQYYDNAIKNAARSYAERKGVDPVKFESAFRHIIRDRQFEETDNFKKIAKAREDRKNREQKREEKSWNKIQKTILKGKEEDASMDDIDASESLSEQLKAYQKVYGTDVNEPVSEWDLEAFKRYQEYLKKKKPSNTDGLNKIAKKKDDKGFLENVGDDTLEGLKRLIKGEAPTAKSPDRGGLLGFLDSTLGRASKSANDVYFPGLIDQQRKINLERGMDNPIEKEATSKADNLLEKGADITGTIAGYTAPSLAAYGAVSKPAQALFNSVNKGRLTGLGAVAGVESVKGAGSGALIGVGEAIRDETQRPDEYNLTDHLKRIGVNAAAGAVLDPALVGLGNAIKIGGSKVLQRFFNRAEVGPDELKGALDSPDVPQEVKQEILALPEGQKLLGLPEGKTETFIPARRAQPDYYATRLNDLISEAAKVELPPGRELEAVADIWSRMAGPEDPGLDELIRLGTPSLRDLQRNPADMLQKARQSQRNKVYGVDSILNTAQTQTRPFTIGNKGEPLQFKQQKPSLQRFVEDMQAKRQAASTSEQALNIEPQPTGAGPVRQTDEAMAMIKEQPQEPAMKRIDNFFDDEGEAIAKQPILSPEESIDATKLKDLNPFTANTQDMYRNFRDVFGKNYESVKKKLLDPFDQAKGQNIDFQKKWSDSLQKEVVDKLGIKKGSKLSKLVQDYGEGTISLEDLKREAPQKWQDVVEADKWFRKAYDELIDQVNTVRRKIYGHLPEKEIQKRLVPKRDNYYRHFRELEGFEGIRNLFDTPAGIDPSLVGVSDFTQPNSRWASFMQKRGLGKYKSDAVGGFLDYLPASSYSIHIDPFIPKFRRLRKELSEATGETRNLNHFIEFLNDQANDLAGKTNFLDRGPQKLLGRRTFGVIQWLNTKAKKNAVLGNAASALAQVANVPQGVAFAKQYSVPGMRRTLKTIVEQNPEIQQSQFLKERFGRNMYNKFDTGVLKNAENFAGWMLESVDKIGSSFIWNSAYEKGLAQGVKDPIKYADDMTRNLVAGRGIGEVPLAQKSKLVQMVAPFQIEVANLWRVQKDFIKEKDFGALITLYLGSYVLNKGMEETRGSGVTFDPIDAIVDAFTAEDLSALERVGRLAGEVLSNVPGGQTLASVYPEYGTDKLPTREELFGDRDPNRFGEGLLIAKSAQDPLYKLAMPFGGAQLKKTVEGLKAVGKEGAYTRNGERLKYPVEDNLRNRLQGTFFGPYAVPEAQKFYDEGRSPLSAKQTTEYEKRKSNGTSNAFYNDTMNRREIKQLEKLVDKVKQDKELTKKERQRKLDELMKRLRAVKAAN